MQKKSIFLIFLLFSFFNIHAQKKSLSHEVYDIWQSIENEQVSRDGQKVSYSITPQDGDAILEVYWTDTQQKKQFSRGEKAQFSYNANHLIFKIKAQKDSVEALRRQKVDKKKLPKDSLGIYDFVTNTLTKVPQVQSFAMPNKAEGWLAYQLEIQKDKTKEKDSTDTEEEPKKLKKESKDSGTKLILQNLTTIQKDTFLFVKEYLFDENGKYLAFSTTGNDDDQEAGVYVYDLQNQFLKPALAKGGTYKNLVWDKSGEHLAFVADTDTSENHEKALVKYYALYHWQPNFEEAQLIANENTSALPENWMINEYQKPILSENGKLYFGTNPIPLVQDTTLLPEEIISVEVWHYQDGYLQTQQNANLKDEKKKAYWAVADLNTGNTLQLANLEIPEVKLGNKGNSTYVLGVSDVPYRQLISWEGFPPYYDFYLINTQTGEKQQIVKKVKGYANFSPAAKYVYWYNVADTAWYSYSIENQQLYNVTKEIDSRFYNEFHDYPDYPWAYGNAGWTEDDAQWFIYDRYDIWAVDPSNHTKAQNLTNGRKSQRSFRYVKTNSKDDQFIPQEIYLQFVNEEDKSEGLAKLDLNKSKKPQVLLESSHHFSDLQKAEENTQIIFSRENFQESPNLFLADSEITNTDQISNINPQQDDYFWGSVELTTWQHPDGSELEGMIYKPENFDPNQQYPLMVYFYERNTHNLHRYIAPAPIRSIINRSYFTSNGYVVFVPDVKYVPGYPGQSAYDCVISGTEHMIQQGYVDKERIGVQGHSWGGYQIAYLVTKTNIFKCAEAGAPVSNMTSAYGGIRWRSGLSRMFQYEHSQSRLGATLWDNPDLYLENSPLFEADKIDTPLLMMHNDEDGAVPWYQGIELFVALRRLGRPVWMLNYNGEAHGLQKRQNKTDFAIRLYQFFDYYLKDEPAPIWLKEGIPAIQKGINTGLDLEKK